MKYILYSPPHEMVRDAFRRTTTGEEVPRKVFQCGARALYRHKKFKDRRYRSDFPCWDDTLSLVKCKTFREALSEQEALKNYCGEVFEIHEYQNGELGARVDSAVS